MYYPNHEEKFFNQGISGLYVLQFQGKSSWKRLLEYYKQVCDNLLNLSRSSEIS